MNHTIVPAVALLLEVDNKIFVGRRKNTGYHDGKLNSPAGHIDPDETPKEAIVRECLEEIGVSLDADKLEFVHVQYNRNLNTKFDRTHYFYRIDGSDVSPENTEPEKCSEVMWIPLGENLDYFVPFMSEAIKHIISGEQYSEFYEKF